MSHRLPDTVDLELLDVLPWRRGRLERAGFDPVAADTLARDGRIDLHSLLELIDRGCSPELAARIVAPLDSTEIASR